MNTYVLDFAEDWAPVAIDERELEQFYSDTVPAGGPALAEVREHVIAALVRTKQSTLAAPAPPIDLHLLYTLEGFVELPVGGPKELAGTSYVSATEAVEHFSAIRAAIDEAVLPDDLRERTDEQLLAACDAIASVGAPVRLLEAPYRMAIDEQVAVLASAGILLRQGTTRAQLASNYEEDEMAARPWECLFDFTEHSDHLSDLAMKCIETTDDREAYASVVKAFATLARGNFPVEQVTSEIDFDRQTAVADFVLDGKREHIVAAWRGEWLDMAVLAQLDRLLQARAPGWGFYGVARGEGMMTLATDRAGYLRLRAGGAPFRSMIR